MRHWKYPHLLLNAHSYKNILFKRTAKNFKFFLRRNIECTPFWFSKLINQRFIYNQSLIAILTRYLVFMPMHSFKKSVILKYGLPNKAECQLQEPIFVLQTHHNCCLEASSAVLCIWTYFIQCLLGMLEQVVS